MRTLGVRCSNSDYTFCILSGDGRSPDVECVERVAFPKDYTDAEVLKWLNQEVRAILADHTFDAVGLKRAETNVKRSNSLEVRIQAEAIVALAASEIGCSVIDRKVNSTIAKDLGLKGKAKYLQTKLDTSVIPDFDDYSEKERDAILVAWSFLN